MDENPVPTLPNYGDTQQAAQKPVGPQRMTSKQQGPLNKLMSKMLKPRMKMRVRLPKKMPKKKHEVHFY